MNHAASEVKKAVKTYQSNDFREADANLFGIIVVLPLQFAKYAFLMLLLAKKGRFSDWAPEFIFYIGKPFFTTPSNDGFTYLALAETTTAFLRTISEKLSNLSAS